MADYYSVKQMQDLLKVDRITIYRMLQDGRLKGIKVGHQWRFSQTEVDRLLGGGSTSANSSSDPAILLPVHCIQTIQNLFSDISQMTALVVDMQGNPLTEISYPCAFCSAMNRYPSGASACRSSWQELARISSLNNQTFTCHAGLNYTGSPILDQGVQIGAFITGGFYIHPPDRYEESDRVKQLASRHQIPASMLQELILAVPSVSPERRSAVEGWPRTAALAVQSILLERTGLITRLQKIANLSQI